jgi:hypothetical protein
MAESPEPGLPRRKTDWAPRGRAPRPYDDWILSLIIPETWRNSRPDLAWLIFARKLAKEHGCRVVFDVARRWSESQYAPDYRGHGPAVLIGGVGEGHASCTAFLHELGHHVLRRRGQEPRGTIEREVAAWVIAQELAAQHRLPLDPRYRRLGLRSHRLAQEFAATNGSKARTRKPKKPGSWRLEESRRSAGISVGLGFHSQGKKGKRHAKRFVKDATSRAERRKPVPEDD